MAAKNVRLVEAEADSCGRMTPPDRMNRIGPTER
jgi:hypothetical protein